MQTVTLTNANQNYDLATLLLAVNANERIHAASIVLQAEFANTGDVLIGDATMTATSFGMRLQPGDAWNLDSGGGANRVHLNEFQARSAAAGQKVNIGVFVE